MYGKIRSYLITNAFSASLTTGNLSSKEMLAYKDPQAPNFVML